MKFLTLPQYNLISPHHSLFLNLFECLPFAGSWTTTRSWRGSESHQPNKICSRGEENRTQAKEERDFSTIQWIFTPAPMGFNNFQSVICCLNPLKRSLLWKDGTKLEILPQRGVKMSYIQSFESFNPGNLEFADRILSVLYYITKMIKSVNNNY